jgi:hypothetical protein
MTQTFLFIPARLQPMNQLRQNFYKRVRLFCDLRVRHVSDAIGISEFAITQIERHKREPNGVEARLIESFLRDRVRIVFEMEGPLPGWVNHGKAEPAFAVKLLGVSCE